jgi:hypothetical protein
MKSVAIGGRGAFAPTLRNWSASSKAVRILSATLLYAAALSAPGLAYAAHGGGGGGFYGGGAGGGFHGGGGGGFHGGGAGGFYRGGFAGGIHGAEAPTMVGFTAAGLMGFTLAGFTAADSPAGAFTPGHRRARGQTDFVSATRKKTRPTTPSCCVAASEPGIGTAAGMAVVLAMGGVTTRIFGRMTTPMTMHMHTASRMARNLGIARIPPAITLL